ncbi:MAG: hypothetical protein H7237_08275 [Alkalinema sp. FL-bin-369]|nr:hypothetical protein [Leptolyngbyaceae cyanobacterium LF-bin-369]
MPELTQSVQPIAGSTEAMTSLYLAQQLAQQLAIGHKDWHRLQSNRPARAQEQAAIAMVYLLKGESALALAHLQQATAWLDRSVSAPPCPH